jgi:SWI/SNF-related matrix-associated actin-dependent regulator 1 of chromatin subfamily A
MAFRAIRVLGRQMTLPYFQYQQDGGDWLVRRERFGLHDEMGVGKTATVWNAVDKIGAERGIIVCPAMLRENWIGEYRKFVSTPRRLCKGQNIHDFQAWKKGRFNILITSYELATKWADEIRNMGEPLDFIAFDEGHYMKNSGAQRTKRLLGPNCDGTYGMIEWAQRVWHVTGTPMANDPQDIYTFLRMCDAMQLPEATFTKRYFHKILTRFGARMQPRTEMIAELQSLISNNSIRRTKRDIGMQLPPIFLTTALVDGDTDAVSTMLREFPGVERAILAAVDQGGLSFLDAQHIMTLRRLIGEAKAVPYGHMLLEELMSSATDKRVVYGIHVSALETLRDFLLAHGINAVLVNGSTRERDRVEAVKSFQEDPEVQVFIGNIRAAGVGLTLTAACEIDMLESDWSPAGNAQAIMRIHRIGQTRNVRARFITLANSLDEVVNRIVAQKTAAIASIEGEAMHAAPLDVLAQFA